MTVMNEDGHMEVLAPENVSIEYDLAGLGSRFVACFLDTLIQTALLVSGIIVLAVATDGPLLEPGSINPFRSIAGAVMVLYSSVVLLGYHIFFETLWNGQSPGKRWTKLRVRKDGGYGIGFTESAIRNLLRLVDFLPYLYGVGAVVMLFSKRGKRLGDYAAGTVVVKERAARMPDDRFRSPIVEKLDDETVRRIEAYVSRLTRQELSTIREFLRRREELGSYRADPMAAKLYVHVAGRMGMDDSLPGRGQVYTFLYRVVDAHDHPAGTGEPGLMENGQGRGVWTLK